MNDTPTPTGGQVVLVGLGPYRTTPTLSELLPENAALREEIKRLETLAEDEAAKVLAFNSQRDAELSTLRATNAGLREALERIASEECYEAVPGAENYAEEGRYTLPERTEWFRKTARAALDAAKGGER